MTLVFPSTNKIGNEGSTGFRDVNFKTKQDFAVSLTKEGRRYLIERISLISKTITGASTGATIAVCEGTLGADTDATITLTTNGTLAASGTTVTLGNRTYTLRTALTASTTANEVLLGATAADTLDNLKSAVNLTAGAGTTYGSLTTAHTQITATTNTNTTQVFVASVGASSGRAGNDLTGYDTTSATLTWSNSGAFTGGLDGVLVNAMVAEVVLTTSDQAGLVQNLTIANTAEVLTGGNALIFSIRNAAAGTADIKDIDIEYRVI